VGRNAQRRREDWLNRVKEHKAEGQGSIQVAGAQPKGPFCPMLSQFVVAGASPVVLAGGQQANQVSMELVRVPCTALGRDCVLWDKEADQCGLVSQLEMVADLWSEGEDDDEQIPGANDPGAVSHGDKAFGGPPAGEPQPPPRG
jgi:hypothetical protein